MAPVAKVSLMAMISLLITLSVPQYFTMWLVKCLVAGLFGIAFPLPPLPLYILVVRQCYSLACLLFASCFYFIPLLQ